MKFDYQAYRPLDKADIYFSKIPFPFEEKCIIYIEKEYDVLINQYIQTHYEQICEYFKSCGYTFYYFPFLPDKVVNEILSKFYGETDDNFSFGFSLNSNFMLNYLIDEYCHDQEILPSLLFSIESYKTKVLLNDTIQEAYSFRPFELTPSSKYYMTPDLSNILEVIIDYCNNMDEFEDNKLDYLYKDETDYGYMEFEKELEDRWNAFLDSMTEEEFNEYIRKQEEEMIFDFSNLDDDEEENSYEDEFDSKIKKEIEDKILMLNQKAGRFKYRIATEKNENPEYHHVEPKGLTITKNYKIEIEEFGEVHLNPIQKMYFLFYLNHPEGIAFKQISGYTNELADWYRCVKPTFNKDSNKKVEQNANGQVETSSPISTMRNVFTTTLGKDLAYYYCIPKEKGVAKKIPLPESLVTWECERVPPQKPEQKKKEKVRLT